MSLRTMTPEHDRPYLLTLFLMYKEYDEIGRVQTKRFIQIITKSRELASNSSYQFRRTNAAGRQERELIEEEGFLTEPLTQLELQD